MFEIGDSILYTSDEECQHPDTQLVGQILAKNDDYIVLNWFWANFDNPHIMGMDEYPIRIFNGWKHRCKILTEKELLLYKLKA